MFSQLNQLFYEEGLSIWKDFFFLNFNYDVINFNILEKEELRQYELMC